MLWVLVNYKSAFTCAQLPNTIIHVNFACCTQNSHHISSIPILWIVRQHNNWFNLKRSIRTSETRVKKFKHLLDEIVWCACPRTLINYIISQMRRVSSVWILCQLHYQLIACYSLNYPRFSKNLAPTQEFAAKTIHCNENEYREAGNVETFISIMTNRFSVEIFSKSLGSIAKLM